VQRIVAVRGCERPARHRPTRLPRRLAAKIRGFAPVPQGKRHETDCWQHRGAGHADARGRQRRLRTLRKLIDWHIAEGTDCIGVVGTTGESPDSVVEEHCEIIRVAVEHAAAACPSWPAPAPTPRPRPSS
jgi:hypothetical protein